MDGDYHLCKLVECALMHMSDQPCLVCRRLGSLVPLLQATDDAVFVELITDLGAACQIWLPSSCVTRPTPLELLAAEAV